MRPGGYLALLLGIGLLGTPLLYFGTWAASVLPCRHLDQAGAYLAYCDNTAFGSYEHVAYADGLEPEATEAAARADVLLLGNSRLQHAFSTRAAAAFFADRHATYHLLGFGYGESSRFPAQLLRALHPAPKVVIINADPFFRDVFSPVAYQMALAPGRAWVDGIMKRLFGRLQPTLCRLGLCAERDPAVYRDRRTGQWIWQDLLVPRDRVAETITSARRDVWNAAELPAWRSEAARFLALLPTPRRCILLTGVPTPAIDAEAMAEALGAALDLTVVQPALDGLTTFDNSHLSAASAERWSAAVLAAARPRIDACLAQTRSE